MARCMAINQISLVGAAYSAPAATLVRLRGGIPIFQRVKEALLHRVGKIWHAVAPRVAVDDAAAGGDIGRVSGHESVKVSLPDAVQASLAVGVALKAARLVDQGHVKHQVGH